METQNTIPQPATDYLARLVDFRKRAYAADCVTRWESGQPFATSWPNLKAEYVQDIARKLGRYLSPKGSKPVSAPSPVNHIVDANKMVMNHKHGSPVPSDSMAEIERHMAASGELGIGGGYRFTTITNKAWQSWTKDGDWYIKAEGTGYRIRQGRKSSVFLFEGQLRWMNCGCEGASANLDPVSAPSPVEEWVAEVVEPAAKPVRKPRVSAGKDAPRGLSIVKPEPSRALAKPVRAITYKPQRLTRYTRSRDAIEATMTGGNEFYAGLFTETMGGQPWLEAVTMYQSLEWQDRNRAALTQMRVHGLLAERTTTYAEAAG